MKIEFIVRYIMATLLSEISIEDEFMLRTLLKKPVKHNHIYFASKLLGQQMALMYTPDQLVDECNAKGITIQRFIDVAKVLGRQDIIGRLSLHTRRQVNGNPPCVDDNEFEEYLKKFGDPRSMLEDTINNDNGALLWANSSQEYKKLLDRYVNLMNTGRASFSDMYYTIMRKNKNDLLSFLESTIEARDKSYCSEFENCVFIVMHM
jgi:hypothetical protein